MNQFFYKIATTTLALKFVSFVIDFKVPSMHGEGNKASYWLVKIVPFRIHIYFIKFDKCDHIQPKKFNQLQKSLKPDENQPNSFTFDIRSQAANLITFYIYQQIPRPSTKENSIGVDW